MIGVSPAFFFSKYTTEFTVEDYISGLDELKKLGLASYQGEIYYKERISEWLEKAHLIKAKADELGLKYTQFVAHFMMYTTQDEEALFSDCGYDDLEKICQINKIFNCDVITIPLGPYKITKAAKADDYNRIWNRFCEKIAAFCTIASKYDMRLAMEIVPGSILANTDNLLRLIAETQKDNLGYNFDTGHAWSSKERIELIPSKLKGRIYGTHFKDNFGFENLPHAPGKGSIPWSLVISSLLDSGYTGSFDLEIVAKAEDVDNEYLFGKNYLLNNSNIKEK